MNPGVMTQQPTAYFLREGGEMGELTRNFDWASSPLGEPHQWPSALKTTIGIILQSKFPMFVFWGEELICFYNDAYRKSLGDNDKHPQLFGNSIIDVWPEIYERVEGILTNVLKGGEATLTEDRPVSFFRNGKIQDVYWTYCYSGIPDETGKVGGVFVACTETTEKVINYKKQEESKAQLAFAIDSAELATWDFNPLTNKFTADDRYTEWFGIDAHELIDNKVSIQIIAEEDRAKVIQALQNATDASKRKKYDIEYTIRPSGKSERIVRAKGRAWFNDQQVAYRLSGTLQDVTEQVKSRKLLEESEHRFRTLLEEASVATALYSGPNLQISYANKTMLSYWRKDTSILGKDFRDALPEFNDQPFPAIIENVFATGETYVGEQQQANILVDGQMKPFYFTFTYKPLRNSNGEIYAVHHIALDVTEEVLIKNKIKESEQQVRSLVESAPFPIGVYIGREMRIQLANQSIIDIWGKGNDVIGKKYSDILPELSNQHIFEQLDSVYTTGIAFHSSNQYLDIVVDGKVRPYYFNYSFTPLFNAEGEVYGVMNTGADVTDLNVAHKRIEESENNLRNIILQAPIAMCILSGPNHVISIANDRMFELWGRQSSELLNRPLFDGLPEVGSQGFEDLLAKVFNTGETVSAMAIPVNLPRNGSLLTLFINFVYEAFRDGNGVISGVMVLAYDVTEQVLATKKIEEAEERARVAVASADLGTFEVNLLTDESIMSPRMASIFDVDNNNERQRYISAIHPDDQVIRLKAYEEGVVTGRLLYECRVLKKDGTINWIRITGKFYNNSQDIPERLLGVVQDITEQKLFSETLAHQVNERTKQLAQANENLAIINKELEQFTYAASHDMQEPLRKVQTFSSFLQQNNLDQLDERGKNYLSKIGASVQRMKTIINDLLNYSHQTQDQQELQPVNINEIINDVQADLELLILQKKATVTADSFPAINAVKSQINQLFFNLFSNALKFSKEDEPVSIYINNVPVSNDELITRGLDLGKQYLKITFADNGIGFLQEYAEQIFSLFKRLHGRNIYEGTGIGLGLCKKIVQTHNGAIWATSLVDNGATFHIILPVE